MNTGKLVDSGITFIRYLYENKLYVAELKDQKIIYQLTYKGVFPLIIDFKNKIIKKPNDFIFYYIPSTIEKLIEDVIKKDITAFNKISFYVSDGAFKIGISYNQTCLISAYTNDVIHPRPLPKTDIINRNSNLFLVIHNDKIILVL